MTDKLSLQAILIVENDELLKMLTVELMEDAGYTVLQAGDADEAVAILEARSDIALLLTSVRMPGSIDGLKLAHTARNRWPTIKIIVVSGQTRLSEYDLPVNSRLLVKPYHAEEMISEICSLVETRIGTQDMVSRICS